MNNQVVVAVSGYFDPLHVGHVEFLQLAKDAQSNGDPVLAQNYLQHADHYLRRYNELNERKDNSIDKLKSSEKSTTQEEKENKQTGQTLS